MVGVDAATLLEKTAFEDCKVALVDVALADIPRMTPFVAVAEDKLPPPASLLL
jgi:hypothetical protein